MATPLASRFPRPLKATQTFQSSHSSSSAWPTGKGQPQQTAPGGHTERRFLSTDDNSRSSLPSSPVAPHDESPRRSSSMGSLGDVSDVALWPHPQEGEDMDEEGTTRSSEAFTHKRSNSCSSADKFKLTVHMSKTEHVPVHSRRSVEGLNQEISAVLEGKSFGFADHPDGHRAPVYELVSLTPVNFHSSPSPSTFLSGSPFHGNPPTVHHGSPLQMDGALHFHPHSPKPSFAHKPPEGAERCDIRQDSLDMPDGYIPIGPDKTKANIVFKGNVFAPPHFHHSHAFKSVAIS